MSNTKPHDVPAVCIRSRSDGSRHSDVEYDPAFWQEEAVTAQFEHALNILLPSALCFVGLRTIAQITNRRNFYVSDFATHDLASFTTISLRVFVHLSLLLKTIIFHTRKRHTHSTNKQKQQSQLHKHLQHGRTSSNKLSSFQQHK